ncbi:MAG: HAD family phosphatase [Oscillospiraceae bacterium]|nr:HAD family phosphatase [Oscillospiraceae bacterium]
MEKIKIIAMDLDGTLLDSEKRLSEENRAALQRAADMGIEIVPTTGRIYKLIPEAVRELPFVHYAVTVNGAEVYDVKNDRVLAKSELAYEKTVEIMAYLDGFDVVYDCYQNGGGYMTKAFLEKVGNYLTSDYFASLYQSSRHPVPELKAYLLEQKQGVQKVQFCTKDLSLRAFLLEDLKNRFDGVAISTALPYNGEINEKNAHKGGALQKLCTHLGCTMENVMTLGDGLNDITMLELAGISVAMENAAPEAKAAAKYVTGSCDESGVAQAINKFIN